MECSSLIDSVNVYELILLKTSRLLLYKVIVVISQVLFILFRVIPKVYVLDEFYPEMMS